MTTKLQQALKTRLDSARQAKKGNKGDVDIEKLQKKVVKHEDTL